MQADAIGKLIDLLVDSSHSDLAVANNQVRDCYLPDDLDPRHHPSSLKHREYIIHHCLEQSAHSPTPPGLVRVLTLAHSQQSGWDDPDLAPTSDATGPAVGPSWQLARGQPAPRRVARRAIMRHTPRLGLGVAGRHGTGPVPGTVPGTGSSSDRPLTDTDIVFDGVHAAGLLSCERSRLPWAARRWSQHVRATSTCRWGAPG